MYNLTIGERFGILSILPKRANIQDHEILRKLKERLSTSEEEIKHYEIQQVWRCPACQVRLKSDGEPPCPRCNNPMEPTDSVAWVNPDETAEIEIGDRAKTIITNLLKSMNTKDDLPEELVPIWYKFMEDGNAGES